jgi:hypothetical protein
VKIVRADDGSFLHGRGRSIIGLLVEGSALPVTVAGTVCTGLDKIRKKIEELSGRNRCKGKFAGKSYSSGERTWAAHESNAQLDLLLCRLR